jgi:hypothetical protein
VSVKSGGISPVLAVRGEQAADQQRIQPHDRCRPAARVAQRRDPAADEADRNELLRFRVARERETARRELHAAESQPVRARVFEPRIFAIAEPLDFRDQVLGR